MSHIMIEKRYGTPKQAHFIKKKRKKKKEQTLDKMNIP
jgi:hypothetical protein